MIDEPTLLDRENSGEPLEILFQDEWLAVVNKPAGMLVHPGRDPEPNANIAMKVLRDQLGQRVYPVHRLDRPTSGVLIFPLSPDVVPPLRTQFNEQSISKIYTAVVLEETSDHWICESKIQKKDGEPFREAETHFTRERVCSIHSDTFSVIRAEPKSGRFHQIRKHLLENGTPIVGDFLYGDIQTMERVAESIGQPRLMLHAQSLRFIHPVDGNEIEVSCPLPKRFAPFL
ncbi:MAG: RluA family pseudouridine synthase [Verrucomicrobiales bacterium]